MVYDQTAVFIGEAFEVFHESIFVAVVYVGTDLLYSFLDILTRFGVNRQTDVWIDEDKICLFDSL